MDFLIMAKFEANSDINISTGITPFIATKEYILRFRLKALTPSGLKEKTKKESMKGDKIAKRINDLRLRFKDKLS
jgi:hypothetical protein